MNVQHTRRSLCAAVLGLPWLADRSHAQPLRQQLDQEQSWRFRRWMTVLVHAQLQRGPTPRWTQRDCAGLVRFVAAESLRSHDLAWKRANGLLGRALPEDVDPGQAQGLRHAWLRADGTRGAFASALELVQNNTRPLGRRLSMALPGDLLLYDFGDDQHLMIWMGRFVAYHTGRIEPGDNGLRALSPGQLERFADTRWRPLADNANFTGLHRLDFLS